MAERQTPKDMAKNAAERLAAQEAADAERRLGRYVAIGIPAVAIAGAVVVGTMMSLAPAILVLVGGTLLGTVAFLWASLRTLSGDAPLPLELEAMAARSHAVDQLAEKKRRVLRALKDLEHEHAVGKIDDKDFAALGAKYREDAKELMREMDESIEPLREKAEEIARKHLAAKGLAAPKNSDAERNADDMATEIVATEKPGKSEPVRVACGKCGTSNEPDAAFCKKCGNGLRAEEANA